MARLDVYEGPDGRGYLLDVQADLLAGLDSRLVLPLLRLADAPKPAGRLNPVVEVAGEAFVVVTQFAAAVHVRELRRRVTTLGNPHETITAALDLLTTGV